MTSVDQSDFFNTELTEKERDLYNRQFRYAGWNQSILKRARVLIAGVGGLGCEIAKNLAMVGIGHLDLVDLDVIEHSNLNRQFLFLEANIGAPKATVAAEKLRAINPTIEVIGHHSALERLDPDIYRRADVIIGGLDSVQARQNLNAQAIRFRKPLVDGGVGGFHGHVYTILPYENACYECNPPPSGPSDEMAACTVVGVPRKRVHCVFKGNMLFQETFKRDPDPKKLDDVEFVRKEANRLVHEHEFLPEFSTGDVVKILDRHDPGLITINAVISAVQSHEAIKLVNWRAGNKALGEPMKTYMIFNGMTMKFYYLEKPRNPACPQCGDNVKRVGIELATTDPCQKIIDMLVAMGFKASPDMEPVLTMNDFKGVRIIDPEKSVAENELRTYDLITVAGFMSGEVFITLKIK